MVKLSVNLEERDAEMIDHLTVARTISKSDIIRVAIHEYCEKSFAEKARLDDAIDHAYGVCRETPIDAYAVRKDSNESGRV